MSGYGSIEPVSAPRDRRNRVVVALLAAVVAVVALGCIVATRSMEPEAQELLQQPLPFKQAGDDTQSLVIIKPPPLPVPWSPPDTLWMYWGPLVDKRTYGSGQAVRAIVKMGNIAGGEYRDPHFLKDLKHESFRDLTLTCCSTLLFPPLKHGFPLYKANGRMQHRVSRYVANGNTMIFTAGGLISSLFINRIFHYKLEPVKGNYSPGPFPKYTYNKLPKQIAALNDVMRQEGIEVTVIHKFSLPVGTTIFYASPGGSPFFQIKYCEIMNPKRGEPPVKVTPPYCKKWAKKGRKCACGLIIYLGYDFQDRSNAKWNKALRASLELGIGKPE
eukprot:CAMPEP_0114559246 /NCGR_PEP_ID=MMETSP0114-20121206/10819_1 /TAXON_ID=31324 /ORGANISM="Goniomonas sp, Strain m" /LENGTH=329 /DNA_ID=CAMNT_0001744703 /DNA_START=17 /DNA_END=1006 /DNA_ORIENTATION=-